MCEGVEWGRLACPLASNPNPSLIRKGNPNPKPYKKARP